MYHIIDYCQEEIIKWEGAVEVGYEGYPSKFGSELYKLIKT